MEHTVILPATLSDVGSMIAAAMNVLRTVEPVRNTAVAPPRPPSPPSAPRPAGRPLP